MSEFYSKAQFAEQLGSYFDHVTALVTQHIKQPKRNEVLLDLRSRERPLLLFLASTNLSAATTRAKRDVTYLLTWGSGNRQPIKGLAAAARFFNVQPGTFTVYMSKNKGSWCTQAVNPETGESDMVTVTRSGTNSA